MPPRCASRMYGDMAAQARLLDTATKMIGAIDA
jgi:hypothetical protein